MGRCDIRRVESATSDPDGFGGVMTVVRETAAETDPGDATPSPREIEYRMLVPPPERAMLTYLARIDGEPAGLGWAMTVSQAGDDVQLAEIDVLVRPGFRRRGVATAVIADVIPPLVDLGQNSIVAYSISGFSSEAASALCRRYGLTQRGVERCSRTDVASIDDDLMATWIAGAATSATGYRLEQWEGACPDHLAERWTHAMTAMEDEPLDDYEFAPYTRGADIQRLADETKAGYGYRMFRTLALSPDGEAAGLSDLYVHEDRPEIGHQADTGVLAEHRGHGLGRWMKAANYRQVRRAFPDLAVIQTFNAESNPWMLDINVAMGFAPHHAYTGYQGPIDAVTDAIARHR